MPHLPCKIDSRSAESTSYWSQRSGLHRSVTGLWSPCTENEIWGHQVKDPRTSHAIAGSSDTCAQSPWDFEISTPRHRVRDPKIYIVPRRACPSRDQVATSCCPASYSHRSSQRKPSARSAGRPNGCALALNILSSYSGLNHSGLTLLEVPP